MKKWILFIVMGIVQMPVSGQVIWLEDFNSQANGAQNDPGIWSTVGFNCDGDGAPGASAGNFWGVESATQRFRCNDIEGQTCCGASQQGQSDNFWLSSPISISGYANISISMSASVTGAVECAVCTSGGDLFEASYRIDGGAWIPFLTICGAASGFSTVNCIDVGNGTTLELRVMVGNQANDENYYFDNVQVDANGCPLPVTLSSFYINCTDDHTISATWTTESEINNSHFFLQGSTDGINYSDLTRVEGNHNTNFQHQYQVLIDNTNNYQYFRISQVDLNGDVTSYSPVHAECIQQKSELICYTDQNQIQLILPQELTGNTQVLVYDIHGSLLYEQDEFIQMQASSSNISLPCFPAGGIYLVKVIDLSSGKVYISRFANI